MGNKPPPPVDPVEEAKKNNKIIKASIR